jgi:hypothetical protein
VILYLSDRNNAIERIDKMIRFEIFKSPVPGTEGGYYDVHALQFTEKFIQNCNDVLARLGTDPANISLNTWEGFKSIILNFITEKVGEDELNEMIMLVLSLMKVRKSLQ